MIEARALARSFAGRPAVADLSFTVPEGRLCALLGPNGAGKTTTVRLLLGLLPPTAGTARVAGIPLPGPESGAARIRAQSGLLTEAPGFYDRMSGRENLELFGRLYGLRGPALRDRIAAWLERLDLREAGDRPFGAWSKGMKQRLALIRAVLHEPRVLFLDEPTSGLDPAVAREVRDLIRDFRREGRTILLCTHNLAEAEELADLIGIIRCRMLAFGTRDALEGENPARVEVTLRGDAAPFAARLAAGGMPASGIGPGTLRCELRDPVRDTPGLVRALVEAGAEILALRPGRPTLEEIYLRAVGAEDPAP